jgi:hypothetical protein
MAGRHTAAWTQPTRRQRHWAAARRQRSLSANNGSSLTGAASKRYWRALAVLAGGLQQPGDLGQVVDLLGRHVRLVQLHRHQAVLAMLASALPARPIEAVEQGQVLCAELLPAGQLTLQVQVQ